MKKMSFVLSLVVIGAMLLAACGANSGNNGSVTPGAGETGGTMPTSELGTTPGAGDTGGLAETPTVAGGDTGGSGADTTPTADTGAGTDATPTVEAGAGGTGSTDTTPTAEAGAGTGSEGSGQAGIGEMSNFALLSDLLQVSVNSGDGKRIGSVAGVVINRPSVATSGTSGSDTSGATGAGTGSGSGSGADAAATPTVDSMGKGSGTGSTSSGSSGSAGTTSLASSETPSIDYVLVNVTAGSGSDTSGSTGAGTSGSSGTGGTTDKATATPAAGDSGSGTGNGSGSSGSGSAGAGSDQVGGTVAVPWEAFRTQTGVAGADTGAMKGDSINELVLDMDAGALAGAPSFPSDDAQLAQGWDTDAQAYWSGQGLSIPATGAAGAEGEAVVIRDSIGTMDLISQDGQNVGQVTDFVIDLTTGDLVYAILSGDGTNAGSFYAVPVENFTWSGMADASADSLGQFSATFPQTAFDNAPSFSSMDEMDLSGDWNSEVDTYWQSQAQ